MHELPIIRTIFRTVTERAEAAGAEKIRNVYLEVGVLRDFVPAYMKKYWTYITKDTIADGSELLIHEVPAAARCGQCKTEYPVRMDDLVGSVCPKCGYEKGELTSGRELIICGIQIEGKDDDNDGKRND